MTTADYAYSVNDVSITIIWCCQQSADTSKNGV